MTEIISVLVPVGMLGVGVQADEVKRGIAAGADVIALDAGSTDSGATYLATGVATLPCPIQNKSRVSDARCRNRPVMARRKNWRMRHTVRGQRVRLYRCVSTAGMLCRASRSRRALRRRARSESCSSHLPRHSQATRIAKACNPYFFHFPLNRGKDLPSYGFPFSPSEIERGPVSAQRRKAE
jgi:hypothetical protein